MFLGGGQWSLVALAGGEGLGGGQDSQGQV